MKTGKVILATLLSFLFLSQAYGANVEEIKVIDSKNINITFNTGVVLPEGNIDSDIKILKDIAISFVSKDLENESKLILDLNGELEMNSKYSLLSILGPEGNIDFTTIDILDGLEVTNDVPPAGQGINKVVIKDSKTVELFYNNPIEESEFEFKLLSESLINTLNAFNERSISVLFGEDLDEYSNYILMLLSVTDRLGVELSFEEDLHDFNTQDFPEEAVQDEVVEEVIQDTQEPENEIVQELPTPELDEGNLEEISMNAATTPDTGAETWVLLLLTFIANTGIFFRKKLIKA